MFPKNPYINQQIIVDGVNYTYTSFGWRFTSSMTTTSKEEVDGESVEIVSGKDGKAGTDGITPKINSDGEWQIGNTSTGIQAQGPRGHSMQYQWSGTYLGIKTENEPAYSYVDLKGPRGDQGPKGDKGDTGPQGDQGPKGDKGDKGDTGKDFIIKGYYITLADLKLAVTSPTEGDAYGVGSAAPYDIYIWDAISSEWVNNGTIQGPAGLQGEQGPQGEQGLQGPKGDTGLQGPQGLKGDKGDTGAQGLQGPQGLKGDTGATGSQGPQGLSAYQVWLNAGNSGTDNTFLASLKGEKGDKGDTGAQGIQGLQGIQGPKGDKGDTGDTGAQGPQGIQGPQGPQGETGPQGLMGYSPIIGENGNWLIYDGGYWIDTGVPAQGIVSGEYVLTSTTINNKPLTSDIVLNANDIGAAHVNGDITKNFNANILSINGFILNGYTLTIE